jgi:hypothetical protein
MNAAPVHDFLSNMKGEETVWTEYRARFNYKHWAEVLVYMLDTVGPIFTGRMEQMNGSVADVVC